MNKLTRILAAVAAVTMLATGAFAQRGTEVHNTSPLVEVKNEPAPKLFVGAPLPDPLTRGVASFHTESRTSASYRYSERGPRMYLLE